VNPFLLPFIGLCLLLWIGHALRTRIKLLQKLYLPSAVIGGLLGLVVIQVAQVLQHPVPSEWINGWEDLPGFLINIVFACLFLGVALPRLRTVWNRAAPQLAYGQTVAWGQYLVGVGLFVAFINMLWPELPGMFGAIMPVGFEGGHGTAGGLGPTFDKLNWKAGKDFALASATAGILGAVVFGIMLINWAARKGYTHKLMDTGDVPEDDTIGVIPVDRRPVAGRLSVKSDAIDALTLHLAIIGLAVLIGFLIKEGLIFAGELSGSFFSPGIHEKLMILLNSFPLFPLCMMGGLIIQLLEDRYDQHKIIDIGLNRRLQNLALDLLIVAAISTIRIEALTTGLVPLFIMVFAGIAWNIFCIMVLAKRLLPDAWFERAIAEMGQSMGVTATGLLLLRVVDPEYESPAADAFAYKQLLHEPIMGGGLWTSMVIPLLGLGGILMPRIVLGITAAAVAFWLLVAFLLLRARKKASV